MVGGAAADFERARPLFEAMGKTIVHVGGPGAGQVVKACNQIVVAIAYAGLSEALVLGAKAGVDPAKILQVLGGGLANSRVLEMRGPTMIAAPVRARLPRRPAPQGPGDRPRHRQGAGRSDPRHRPGRPALRGGRRRRPRPARPLCLADAGRGRGRLQDRGGVSAEPAPRANNQSYPRRFSYPQRRLAVSSASASVIPSSGGSVRPASQAAAKPASPRAARSPAMTRSCSACNAGSRGVPGGLPGRAPDLPGGCCASPQPLCRRFVDDRILLRSGPGVLPVGVGRERRLLPPGSLSGDRPDDEPLPAGRQRVLRRLWLPDRHELRVLAPPWPGRGSHTQLAWQGRGSPSPRDRNRAPAAGPASDRGRARSGAPRRPFADRRPPRRRGRRCAPPPS